MHNLHDLLELMRRLRDPRDGCPWDLKQNFTTIAPYTLEEAYEVADAIERGDMQDLKKELGDLLFQVVFHARLAEEMQEFTFHDVVDTITEKMLRRHPHVFGDRKAATADEVRRSWEAIKQQEHGAKHESLMDTVSKSQPALNRAKKLQIKAAGVGFDWPELQGLFAKLQEEIDEVQQVLQSQEQEQDQDRLHEEIGDLLFTCVNLSRFLHIDPEAALRIANAKFEKRFRGMEQALKKQDKQWSDMDLGAMEALWQAQKSEKP